MPQLNEALAQFFAELRKEMVRSTNQTPEETRGGGGPRVKPRLTTPKMFATGKKRCPVAFLRSTYINVKTTGPVYLGVIDKPQTTV